MQYVKDLSEIDSLSDDDEEDGEENEDGWNYDDGSGSKTYMTSPAEDGSDDDGGSISEEEARSESQGKVKAPDRGAIAGNLVPAVKKKVKK